jgi:hypothetical protein
VVTVELEGYSFRVMLVDLLLSTSDGRFHLDALSQDRVITVPGDVMQSSGVSNDGHLSERLSDSEVAKAALTVVSALLSNYPGMAQIPVLTADVLPEVLRVCTYIGAESMLQGTLLDPN